MTFFPSHQKASFFFFFFGSRFFSRPYFLRLHLPSEVEETDEAKAEFSAETKSFLVRAPKKRRGQEFEGLQMLTSLLSPRAEGAGGIQQLGEDGSEWFVEQELPEEDGGHDMATPSTSTIQGYGFAFAFRGVFKKDSEAQEVLDVKDPDEKSLAERREARIEQEKGAFSEEHYLGDLFESEEVDRIIQLGLWQEEEGEEEEDITREEQERMLSLPRQIPPVSKEDLPAVFCGLVDLLFASCYDLRTGEGERSSESGWTVAKLAATMTCAERFDALRDCVVSCLRRSVCFPLYRNFDLSVRCLRDVVVLLARGNVAVLRALLGLIPVLIEGDRHLFAKLYLEPYSSWVQRVPPARLATLSKELDEVLGKVGKDDLDLELTELEKAGELVKAEEEEEEEEEDDRVAEVAGRLSGVTLGQRTADSDDDDDDDSSSSDSDDSSSEEGSDEDSEEENASAKEEKVPSKE